MQPPSKSLLAEIASVQLMNADEIIRKYPQFLPRRNVARETKTLRQEAIYRLQESFYGISLSPDTIDVLNASLEKRSAKATEREAIMPGTQFVREYHGERHVLIYRSPKQYEYRGMTYRSPSVVAKRITGTNWNGREFFKLPSLKSLKEGN